MPPVFDPLRFGAVSMDVLASRCASASALASRQQTRLANLLGVAKRDSRFYQRHLRDQAARSARLEDLPTVSRRELMDNFDDWVTDPQLKLTGLRAFTADPARAGEPYLGKYLVWESSGTSRQPGIFVQDARTMAVYDALQTHRQSPPRPLQRWVDPMMLAERIAFVGVTNGHFASYLTLQRMHQCSPWMSPPLRCVSILQSTRAVVEELNEFAPTVIATYPTAAALLADVATQGALQCRPQEVWTGGETLSAPVRQYVETALGCAVRNSYGASECISIAWECDHGALHVNADWVILEPVDEQGHPVPAGVLSYTTLLTNLANHVQPLIRYDIGDQIAVQPDACGCGCSLPVIEVQGRRDDPLTMLGKSGHPVTVLPLALTSALEEWAGVFDFHVRQQDDHTLELRLALQGDEGQAALVRCRAALKRFTVEQELSPLQLVCALGQPTPRGRSGKAQRIVAR